MCRACAAAMDSWWPVGGQWEACAGDVWGPDGGAERPVGANGWPCAGHVRGALEFYLFWGSGGRRGPCLASPHDSARTGRVRHGSEHVRIKLRGGGGHVRLSHGEFLSSDPRGVFEQHAAVSF